MASCTAGCDSDCEVGCDAVNTRDLASTAFCSAALFKPSAVWTSPLPTKPFPAVLMVTLAFAAVAVAKNAIPTSAATFRVRFKAVPLYESRDRASTIPGHPVRRLCHRSCRAVSLNGLSSLLGAVDHPLE